MKRNILWMLALALVFSTAFVGCETTPTQQGALIGGGVGAATGAIIGNQVHRSGEGALIGGAIGALGGAIAGDQVEQARRSAAARPVALPPRPPAPAATVTVRGHYENRIVRTATGETYEERVWVPDR